MRADLPGQYDLPIIVMHNAQPRPSGTKEELAIRIAKLLGKYEDKPSSNIWAEIQACASEILK